MVVEKTLSSKPKGGTHWSCRSMAKETGLSKNTINRIWQAFSLKPHQQKHFTLSTDPFFVDKVRDIVGLYLNPPDKALVLCVDEKTQIQALDRTQPILPLDRLGSGGPPPFSPARLGPAWTTVRSSWTARGKRLSPCL